MTLKGICVILTIDTRKCFLFELKNETLRVGEKMKKIARFFVSVKKELKKVRWLGKKELVTYSVATISFVIIFMAFFALSDIILGAISTVIK